jgi:hypothetical protein
MAGFTARQSGAVKAGEEAPLSLHRRAGKMHEATVRAVMFTLPE